MWRLLLVLSGCVALWGQAAFKPNAQIGVPARVGPSTTVSGSKEVLEIGLLRELALDPAELALVCPNRAENIVATAEEKLLVVRGGARDTAKAWRVVTVTNRLLLPARWGWQYLTAELVGDGWQPEEGVPDCDRWGDGAECRGGVGVVGGRSGGRE